jgi:hypothetical protein
MRPLAEHFPRHVGKSGLGVDSLSKRSQPPEEKRRDNDHPREIPRFHLPSSLDFFSRACRLRLPIRANGLFELDRLGSFTSLCL